MIADVKVFGAPGRYLQGAGALSAMGEYLARVGRTCALVADRAVMDLVGARIVELCRASGISCEPAEFSGEITPAEIDRLARSVDPGSLDFVIGCGGGKGIDAGKAVAHALGVRVVTIPTAASNDAPTSKNYVLYDADHRLLRVEHLPANPDVVIVDTEIVARAPVRLFTAGIGDAVVKKFEVAQCDEAGGPNMFGGRVPRAAVALAGLCYDILRTHAVAALEAVRVGRVTEDVERVVEATVLHSGLGFESGGLSISHAMTRGLSAVHGARDALHGHQVAYALLVQLALERRSREFVDDIRGFYRSVELPTSLSALGMPRASDDDIARIAEATMTAPHVRNFRESVDAAALADAIRAVEFAR